MKNTRPNPLREQTRRRRQLMRMMGGGGIAVLPAAPERTRSRDTHYRFRQDSDFFYLTGFSEPEAVAVLAPGQSPGPYHLFCRKPDPKRRLWDGPSAGMQGATKIYGADTAFAYDDLDQCMPELLQSRERVFYTMGKFTDFDQRMLGWLAQARLGPATSAHRLEEIVALDHSLHDMRLYKSRSELVAMKRAAKITMQAHQRVMKACRPGTSERQLFAELSHEFAWQGAESAYQAIVAAGENACTLHYVNYADKIDDGELVLVDAGAELGNYCSDVSRTFPANGKFTAEQRALYEIVLKAQLAAIEEIREGNSWHAPHEAATKVIAQGLIKIGLLSGTLASCLRDESYRRFFPHRTGHWLGMDVHDVGDYRVDNEWRVLERGMVMTVEPGIYIPSGSKGVAKKWWGIGIRIEDDVAVTVGDPEVLTAGLIKDPDDIERFMARA